MQNNTKKILISAGELSGDMHAANLIQGVTARDRAVEFYGMGGDLMQRAGADIIIDSKSLSVFGVLDIFIKIKKIWSAFSAMKMALKKDKPDLLILVDYPGFNLRLAKAAKKAGVKVLYYISPKVWAWRQSRVKAIKKYVDIMAVIFPFEVEFFEKFNVPVKYVGNPLLRMIESRFPIETAREIFNLDPNHKTVSLFPGSRVSEIKLLLPIMLEASKLLKKQNPNLQLILARADSISDNLLQSYLGSNELEIKVVSNQNYNVIQVSDAVIAASGTATLEIALIGTPLVLIYKMRELEYQIAKRLVKIPYAGLGNILVNKKVIPELLQHDATGEKIAAEIEKILNNDEYRKKMLLDIKEIRYTLEHTEKEEVSDLVIKMLK